MDVDFKIATWNAPQSLSVLSKDIFKYTIDKITIQEIRWVGSGIMDKNYSIYYGCYSRQHMTGTGFVISQKAKHVVTDFKAINFPICYLSFIGR